MARGAVKVLAFAGAREVIGAAELSLQLPADVASAGELLAELCRRFPELAGYRGAIRLAVNGSYVDADQPLCDGDEVALIPPVAGG